MNYPRYMTYCTIFMGISLLFSETTHAIVPQEKQLAQKNNDKVLRSYKTNYRAEGLSIHYLEKIEVTKNYTIAYMYVVQDYSSFNLNPPGSEGAYFITDATTANSKKEYKLIKIEGAPIYPNYYADTSPGMRRFRMFFEPLDQNVKKISLFEGKTKVYDNNGNQLISGHFRDVVLK